MSGCSGSCSSCASSGGCSGASSPQSLEAVLNQFSSVGKVIAVASGKGGVGKSTVTSSLAIAMAKMGKKVGILDADITGPSIPTAFNMHERAMQSDKGIEPAVSKKYGIKVMSLNLITANETDPVIWRGPVIAGIVNQFWSDVHWGELDYIFVDMPPGTGDVPLTVFQSLPVDGVIVVTSPQDLVSMIVTKAVRMAEMMSVPIIGLIENYSYFTCNNCDEKHYIFGESGLSKIAEDTGLEILARLPIDPEIAKAFDSGKLEEREETLLFELTNKL